MPSFWIATQAVTIVRNDGRTGDGFAVIERSLRSSDEAIRNKNPEM